MELALCETIQPSPASGPAFAPSVLILYEYPFTESVRTMLRLEELFDRLGTLVARSTPLDHHFALTTLFEIVEVAARADLKSELLRELERQRATFRVLQGNPDVAQDRLGEVIEQLDRCYERLGSMPGKAGQSLAHNEWLMTLRSRIAIPGGTCEFDLPSYHAWQHRPPEQRQDELQQWASTLRPVMNAVGLLLGLMRDTGSPQMALAQAGQFQQSLSARRTYHMLRLRLARDLDLVPEISGHRLMVSVRMMQTDEEQRPRLATDRDVSFELTLCH